VFCPTGTRPMPSIDRCPTRCSASPSGSCGPRPDVGRRVQAAVEATGAEVVLFGATYPLAMLGPGLADRGPRISRPPMASSTGSRWRRAPTR
jgi:hypothetical protein